MPISRTHKFFKLGVRVFERCLKNLLGSSYLKLAVALTNELDLTHTVSVHGKLIRIKCTGETVRIRAREMLLREPDTLIWIDTFDRDEVFWDVGSNIGVFTLYAGLMSSARVVAFDPLPQNYTTMFENITLNHLSDRVMPFCIAISDQTNVSPLHISADGCTPGGAGCSFGIELDNYGVSVDTFVKHPTIGFSIDDFILHFDVPFPNHLKIDIDGIQEKVVLGARNTLRDPRLKTIMIELQPNKFQMNKNANDIILQELENAKFTCVKIAPGTPNMTNDRDQYPTNNFFKRAE